MIKKMAITVLQHLRCGNESLTFKSFDIQGKCPFYFVGEKKKVPVNYSSIVTDLFDGTIQSSVQCLTCHRVTNIIFKLII